MTQYKFVGNGAGVPGLPHEITDEEAAALGVTDTLRQAVENGNYQAVTVAALKSKSAHEAYRDVKSAVAKKESE